MQIAWEILNALEGVKMFRKLFATTVLMLPFAAHAADLAVKAPPPPLVAPVMSWTGFYVGGLVGYADNNNGATESSFDFGYLDPQVSCLNNNCDGSNAGRVAWRTPQNQSFSARGFGGGAEAGFNYQVDSFVLGAETDLMWFNLNGSASQTNIDPITFNCCYRNTTPYPFSDNGHTTNVTTNASSAIDVLGTLRARGGFLITPSTLIFASGGLAYANVKAGLDINGSVTNPSSGQNPFGGSATAQQIRAGWTAGGGLEQKIGLHWSLKAEYLHYDLGSVSVTNMQQVSDWSNVVGYVTKTNNYKFNGDIARIGVNYTLN
jgi:outer membrane immunogenic protein